jgi:hypothetical protein
MAAFSKYYGPTAVDFLPNLFLLRKGLESRSGNIPEDVAASGLQIIDKAIADRLASSKGKTFAHHLADAHDRPPREPAIKPIHIVIMAYWNLSAEQGRNVTTGDVRRYVQDWYRERKRTLGNTARCPYTGLPRTALDLLTRPQPKNNFQPPVKSKLVRQTGTRPIRLVDFESLMAYLSAQPDGDKRSTEVA